ncbi:major tail protein [Clostridium sporogenes]|uniref:major tail protein n=1 Tax=Clostridium sporogenes TaxID=1509 RepID=UPI0007179ACE|nr:major tail protein [Clostridium sporogenes]KRU42194.1 phi13 family phage major tail protein [Clostridium sporogenes]MBY7066274.1 phage tail protein [Clostridium sporogenes]MBY7069201.1 phage tail protein [Clostridium sporogenes]MCW6065757.1 phage tail protein [Clostridium sporogenes]NFQ01699.1 phage tail protein [Clostridium sporogenes]
MDNKVVPIVDLKKLYVAKLLTDTESGTTFDIPKYLEGVREIGIKPKINSDDYYAEGIKWITETTLADVDVEIDITDLRKEEEAFLLGHTVTKDGWILKNANDRAPEVAILFKSIKGNGKARYVVMFRGTFSISDESYKQKEGKTTHQTKKLKASFAPLHSNELWQSKIDEEDGMTDEKFFKEVIIPAKKAETTEKAILDK